MTSLLAGLLFSLSLDKLGLVCQSDVNMLSNTDKLQNSRKLSMSYSPPQKKELQPLQVNTDVTHLLFCLCCSGFSTLVILSFASHIFPAAVYSTFSTEMSLLFDHRFHIQILGDVILNL